jgi:hypothetical protein
MNTSRNERQILSFNHDILEISKISSWCGRLSPLSQFLSLEKVMFAPDTGSYLKYILSVRTYFTTDAKLNGYKNVPDKRLVDFFPTTRSARKS